MRLPNKCAVITGAGSGIGAAIARRFATEGADVFLLDLDDAAGRRVRDDIIAAGGKAQSMACDVGDTDSVVAAFAEIPRVDILVNNAGIGHIGTLESTEPDDLDRLYRVNVKGVYHGLHAAVPRMIDQGGGVVVNMCSVAAKIGIEARFAYSMTKGAVLSMTLSVARDYVKKHIRCNCLCPARIHTPFVDSFLAKNFPGHEAEIFERLAAWQPIGRMGTPDEVASLALFLCSDESAFITGTAWDIDGGAVLLR